MKKIFLILLMSWIVQECYSQFKELNYIVQCTKDSYLIKSDIIKLDSLDLIDFSDWSFLDSLRNELKNFYDLQFGFDTLNVRMGSITVWVDTSGKIVNYLLVIPKEHNSLYSLEKMESLISLINRCHFNLPKYEKPIRRTFKESERVKKLNVFSFLNVTYLFEQDGNIATTWDGTYERQLNNMLLGDWYDDENNKFIFYKSSPRVYVNTQNPSTGVIDDFRCIFRAGRLYIF